MKIYTKTGDAGETGLWGGTRVSKDDSRVQAYGEVDELNAALGCVLAAIKASPELEPLTGRLLAVQGELFWLGAELAAADSKQKELSQKAPHGGSVPEKLDSGVLRLEREIDQMTSDLPPLKHFILPGGSMAGALLHVGRAVCRRAERSVVTLSRSRKVDPEILMYLNRLSDHLFTAARWANAKANVPETGWTGLQ